MAHASRVATAACLLFALSGSISAQPQSGQPQRDRPQPGQPSGGQPPMNPGMDRPGQPMPGQQGRGGSNRLIQPSPATKVSNEELTRAVQGWNKKHVEALKALTEKYGMPSTAGPDLVVWHNTEPFVQMTVYSGHLEHHFPIKHTDFLEQAVAYEVPADKFDELAEFDGSIIVDRTRGTMAARCDKEQNNLLALNLAHDVVTGKKDVQEARDAYARIALDAMKGKQDPYMQKLQFEPKPVALGFSDEVHPAAAAAGILAAPEDPPMPEDRDPMKPEKDPLREKDPSKQESDQPRNQPPRR